MKHGYILGIDEMRAAIAGHYSVSINDVAIQAFPEGNHLRIQALVMEGEKRLKRNPRLIGNIGADGLTIMTNGSMMQNAPTVGLSIPLFVAEMHPISFINSVLIAVAIWDIRRFDIYG